MKNMLVAVVPIAIAIAVGFVLGRSFSGSGSGAVESSPPVVAADVGAAEESGMDEEVWVKLEESARRIADLEAQLAEAREAAALQPAGRGGIELDGQALVERLTPVFERAMEQGIERQVARWTRELGLDEQQAARLRERLMELGRADLARLGEGFGNPDSWRDRRRGGMGGFDPETLAQAMEETLTPDQFERFERRQAETRAQFAQRSADFQVERLNRRLDLSEEQQDQIFDWVVRSSNPDLVVETETGGADLPLTLSQEEGIRQLLTPEQIEIYDQDMERRREMGEMWRGLFQQGR